MKNAESNIAPIQSGMGAFYVMKSSGRAPIKSGMGTFELLSDEG